MTDWKTGLHRSGLRIRRHWSKTARLESGWKVRMEFWINHFSDCDDIDISLVAYRGLYIHGWTWRKEGLAVGPGGLSVYPVALRMLAEAESVALTKTKAKQVDLYVYGATLPLYMIYRQVLRKRGYHETLETAHELTPYLRKVLR